MPTKRFLSAAVAALSLGAPAGAADIDLLAAAPELSLAESRAGAYLRADLFADFASDVDLSRALVSPLGAGVLPLGHADLGDAPGFGLGVGYQFTDMLRADVTARYAEPSLDTAPFFLPGCGVFCFGRDGTDAREWEVLANAYVDLGTFAGFTPYAGGSLGAVHLSYEDPALALCGAGACATIPGSDRDGWRFAYALSAGVAYDVTEDVALDLGYRYLDADGDGATRFDGLGAAAPGAGLLVSDDGFRRHALRLGLRYKFR